MPEILPKIRMDRVIEEYEIYSGEGKSKGCNASTPQFHEFIMTCCFEIGPDN